ncbi:MULTISPECIES: DMT family transporter [Neobacillus]|jgi:bacterial/archaeal transporter family-2 protein|uniref:DMT family transporter n=1 Tax=Neobacillus sedimentimangrovi TaxID=2699460 RepID=A0ABS8QE78_9BACI|nr:DMT family transporter [Neobacillus sedimentimangrovi]AIM16970.1 membrane protein [Bacillus sp. X1(2014)]MCD4837560.1 DMT family transporter [Neobacillus sedimentimangrovi]
MKILFPILAFIGGIAVAIQGQINGGLGKKAGVLEAAFISFGIGTLALFFTVIFFGKGNLFVVTTVPKWQLIGGLLGAIYVIVAVFSVPKIGVAPTLAAVIAGQIIMGIIIDHFGLFGGTRIPIDMKKIVAMVLLFISIYLFNQK